MTTARKTGDWTTCNLSAKPKSRDSKHPYASITATFYVEGEDCPDRATAHRILTAPVMLRETPLGDILNERISQIEKGYTPEHDDEHDKGELAEAASIVAADLEVTDMEPPGPRQWAAYIFGKHEGNRRRQLVIAAAMLVAEIERMDRVAAKADTDTDTDTTTEPTP